MSPEDVGSADITQFSVTLRADSDSDLVELVMVGELDFAQKQRVLDAARTALRAESVRRLVVDLSGVRFIDSGGVGALVAVYKLAGTTGRTVALRDPTPAAAAVLRVTAVETLFDR